MRATRPRSLALPSWLSSRPQQRARNAAAELSRVRASSSSFAPHRVAPPARALGQQRANLGWATLLDMYHRCGWVTVNRNSGKNCDGRGNMRRARVGRDGSSSNPPVHPAATELGLNAPAQALVVPGAARAARALAAHGRRPGAPIGTRHIVQFSLSRNAIFSLLFLRPSEDLL